MFTPTISLWYDFDEVEGMWGSLSGCYIESTDNMIWRLDASIGMGSEDIAVAYQVWQEAVKMGIGTKVDLEYYLSML